MAQLRDVSELLLSCSGGLNRSICIKTSRSMYRSAQTYHFMKYFHDYIADFKVTTKKKWTGSPACNVACEAGVGLQSSCQSNCWFYPPNTIIQPHVECFLIPLVFYTCYYPVCGKYFWIITVKRQRRLLEFLYKEEHFPGARAYRGFVYLCNKCAALHAVIWKSRGRTQTS